MTCLFHSILVSFISGITLLGTPTEVYLYGAQYLYIMGSLVLMGLCMFYIFLPVFHELNLISTYKVCAHRSQSAKSQWLKNV